MNVADELRATRARKRVSRTKAAKEIGVSIRTLARWESGELQGITWERLLCLSDFLDISLNEIVYSLESQLEPG